MISKTNLYFVGVVLLLMVTGVLAPDYLLDVLAIALIYGLFAASVDFSYGYTGILNLGSALYFGLGAYIMAFGLKANVSPILMFITGVVIALIIATIIGYVGFRVKTSQVHYGLIGLAITLGFEQLVISLYDITGGSNGITNVPRPTFSMFGIELALNTPLKYFIFVVLVVSIIIYVLWKIVHSDFGRAIKALRHDEVKLETMGYNPLMIKLSVNGVTAAVSAIAGALFVSVSGIAYPSLFGVVLSMSVLIWVTLGGIGSLIGPVVLAFALKISENALSSSFQDTYILIIGAIFVIMVVMAPEGVTGLLKTFIKKRGFGISKLKKKGETL